MRRMLLLAIGMLFLGMLIGSIVMVIGEFILGSVGLASSIRTCEVFYGMPKASSARLVTHP